MATGSSARPFAIWKPVNVLDQFVCSAGRHMATGSVARPVTLCRPVQMLDAIGSFVRPVVLLSVFSEIGVNSVVAVFDPNTMRNVVASLVIGAEVGIDIDLRFFEELANISKNPGTPITFYINIKSRYGILRGKLNKTHEWFQCYFFVQIDPASVADLNAALRGNWNPSPSRASSDFASSVDWLLYFPILAVWDASYDDRLGRRGRCSLSLLRPPSPEPSRDAERSPSIRTGGVHRVIPAYADVLNDVVTGSSQ
ncbi:hypothetical protein DY000_02053209 [Brassica cretica]|uniref:Uncharacterized protein n=1 Tax=Brassica cretica TaxID=69181 RepID=A0ABQ7A802_BRACR|nr:hypothetical protein DY000_02053209 [Brassica cretica]